jgi:hypothetical protein
MLQVSLMFGNLCSWREDFCVEESSWENAQSVDGAGVFDGGSEDLPPPK